MNYIISDGKYTATVSDLGAELIGASCGNFEFIWQNNANFWNKHAPLLFPVCGRIKDGKYSVNGKEYDITTHGFIRDKVFTLKEKTDTRLVFEKKADADTLKIYPFDFTFIAEYEIKDGALIFRANITNDSDTVMPYMFGWHPGFSYPDSVGVLEDLTLDFGEAKELSYHPLQHRVFVNPKSETVKLDDGKYKINTKHLYDTDTIIFSGMGCGMTLSSAANDYTLDFTWSDNLPYLCIWKEPDNNARFLCLEPWSSLPGDGETYENFDTRAMRRLQPKESESFVYTMKIVK